MYIKNFSILTSEIKSVAVLNLFADKDDFGKKLSLIKQFKYYNVCDSDSNYCSIVNAFPIISLKQALKAKHKELSNTKSIMQKQLKELNKKIERIKKYEKLA